MEEVLHGEKQVFRMTEVCADEDGYSSNQFYDIDLLYVPANDAN